MGVLSWHSNVVGGIIPQACSCLFAHLLQRAVLATCIPAPLFSAPTMSVQQSPIAPGLKSLLTSSEARSQSGTAEQSSSHQLATPAASQAGLYASSSTVPSSSQLPGPSGATSGGCSYIILGSFCWVAAAEVPPLALWVLVGLVSTALYCIADGFFLKFSYVYFCYYYHHRYYTVSMLSLLSLFSGSYGGLPSSCVVTTLRALKFVLHMLGARAPCIFVLSW